MKVMICPLDWGLGHATRCVPIIDALLENGHEVIIAAGGPGYTLLRQEFPDLQAILFPNYRVRYSRSRRWFVPMIYLHTPGFLLSTIREYDKLRRLCKEHGVDFVISDNRYGLSSNELPSVIISHQLFIRSPLGLLWSGPLIEQLLLRFTTRFLSRFSEVWVPDFPDSPNLSGELSHKPNTIANLHYIGLLTRFKPQARDAAQLLPPNSELAIDLFATISGVEPQRMLLEETLREQMARLPGTRVLALGLPATREPGAAEPDASPLATDFPDIRHGELNIFPYLNRRQMEACMRAARVVVCRSGYTTVMELAQLAKEKVLFIPTPGQTEQEYLGDSLEAQQIALSRRQEDVNLATDLPALSGFYGFQLLYDAPAADDSKNGDELKGHEFTREVPTIAKYIASHPLLGRASAATEPD